MLAQFPKSNNLRIQLSPDISRRFKVHGLKAAHLVVWTPNTYNQSPETQLDAFVQLKTAWQLQVRQGSSIKLVGFHFVSTEPLRPALYASSKDAHAEVDYANAQDFQSEYVNLGQVHPTFYIHQELTRSLTIHPGDLGEPKALQLAKLAFELADKEYKHKRLKDAIVGIRELSSTPIDPFLECNVALSRSRYEQSQASMATDTLELGRHRAYLALGSNVGDRISMIESACREMNSRGLRVNKTSALYETKAMYLEDQQSFINGACEVRAYSLVSMTRISCANEKFHRLRPRLIQWNC